MARPYHEGDPMTESEWFASTDPQRMLPCLPNNISRRKLQLLAAACCRRVIAQLQDGTPEATVPRDATGATLAAVAWLEHVADAQAPAESPPARPEFRYPDVPLSAADYVLRAVQVAMGLPLPTKPTAITARTYPLVSGTGDSAEVRWSVAYLIEARRGAACFAAGPPPPNAGPTWHAAWRAAHDAEAAAQAALFRCVLGNPMRPPPAVSPAWLSWQGDTVSGLAQAAYAERQLPSGQLDAGRLAVLADALEEAGCTDTDLLGHLRGPGPHVRGC
jgi:hypothetical protein